MLADSGVAEALPAKISQFMLTDEDVKINICSTQLKSLHAECLYVKLLRPLVVNWQHQQNHLHQIYHLFCLVGSKKTTHSEGSLFGFASLGALLQPLPSRKMIK